MKGSRLSVKKPCEIFHPLSKNPLRIENVTQYTNYQLNNSIKNQIYLNMSHNKYFWTDYTIR